MADKEVRRPTRVAPLGAAAATIASSDYGCHNTAPAGQSKAPGQAPIHAKIPSISFSEDALALAFAERHAGTIRYVAALTTRHKWFIWSESTQAWELDQTLYVLWLVREFCREVSARCEDTALAMQLASASFFSAVERSAREDRRLAATKEAVGLAKRKAARKTGQKRTGAAETALDADTGITAETDDAAAEATMADAIIARARKGRVP
jgi:hypothetical protein